VRAAACDEVFALRSSCYARAEPTGPEGALGAPVSRRSAQAVLGSGIDKPGAGLSRVAVPAPVRPQPPVVFTDGAGPYGADELHAPYFPALENHVIEHSLGVTPVVVWVTPQDSIPDIRAIHSIVVIAQDDSTVTLQVSGQPGQTGRVRFSVYLLAE
jgi:hypothetical protein